MLNEPEEGHRWLQRLAGEWTYEGECSMGPDHPPAKSTGRETVRSLGGLWIVAEGEGEMPGGGKATSIMTVGFDPRTKRYTGTWIGSMMAHLWVYDGELDSSGKVLTLHAEGPSMWAEGKMAKYRDVIEMVSDDHRVMASHTLGDDGKWNHFMTVHFRRM